MEIRKTRMEELDKVMEIYAYARGFMTEHGNPTQWGETWPPREYVENDIRVGKSYVCVEGDEIAAVFYFAKEQDPSYDKIYEGQWLNDEEYAVVHRIASSGKIKGAGSFCMNWASKQCKNVKIDTHKDNYIMQNMLKKCGFQYCGIVYCEIGEERIAFQKVGEIDS